MQVAPVVVIDPSGELTNADTGLANMLVARIVHLKADMDRTLAPSGDLVRLLLPSRFLQRCLRTKAVEKKHCL